MHLDLAILVIHQDHPDHLGTPRDIQEVVIQVVVRILVVVIHLDHLQTIHHKINLLISDINPQMYLVFYIVAYK